MWNIYNGLQLHHSVIILLRDVYCTQHFSWTGLGLGHCNILIILYFRLSSLDLLLLRFIMLLHDTFSRQRF